MELKVKEHTWYAWHLFPGYCNAPYLSPIYVRQVEMLAADRLRLTFFNAFDSEGAQDECLELKITKQARDYWVCDVVYANNPALERTAVLAPISYSWMYAEALDFISAHPARTVNDVEEDIQSYLDRELKR